MGDGRGTERGAGAGDEPELPFDDLLDAGLSAALKAEDRASAASAPTGSAGPGPALRPGASTPDGRYDVIAELGRGGMGLVFEGRDRKLMRQVAIKVLKRGAGASGEDRIRFVEEARIAAQLEHPGIVPVHSMEEGEEPYFAMKRISGETLKEQLARRQDVAEGRERFLMVFQRVAETMAYAHARGVIHRDLKPPNIMLGAFGEVHVMDWGLARVLSQRSRSPEDGSDPIESARYGTGAFVTAAGRVAGTPSYMAPEQARGDADLVDARADVFALGAILCEILTGDPPYRGADTREIHAAAAKADLADARARLGAPGLDPELAALALVCLAPDHEERPADAGIVAHLVADWFAGVDRRSRAALEDAAGARARAVEERRIRRLTTALSATVLLAVLGGATAWILTDRSRAERDRATAVEVERSLGRALDLRSRAGAEAEHSVEILREAVGAAEEGVRIASAAKAQDLSDRARALAGVISTDLAAAVAALDRREKDRNLVARLDEIRQMRAVHLDRQIQDREYALAFAGHALDVDLLPAAALAERISASPIRQALESALEWWLVDLPGPGAGGGNRADRILEALLALGTDPARATFLRALRRWDAAALIKPAAVGVPAPPAGDRVELLATLLGNAGRLEEAVALLRAARARNPGDFWTHFALAFWLTELPKPELDEALASYRTALALVPGNVAVKVNLAALLLKLDRVEEALHLVAKVVEQHPGIAMARVTLARALERIGDAAGAERELREVLRHEPVPPIAWNNLAANLSASSRREEALEVLDRAVAARPGYALAHANRLRLLHTLGRGEEADRALTLALAVAPDDPDVLQAGADIHAKGGRSDDALVLARRAVALSPEDGWARSRLASLLVHAGKTAEAAAEFARAVELLPDTPEHILNLGAVLRGLGRFEEALGVFERGHAAASRRPVAGVDSGAILATCREEVAHMRRVTAAIAGAATPEDDAEWLELIRFVGRYRLAVHECALWERRSGAGPIPATSPLHRLRGRTVLASVMAATGQGIDGAGTDEEGREGLMRRAEGFLHAILKEWEEGLADETASAAAILGDVTLLESVAEFAPVRDEPGLAKLPPADAVRWRALWERVRRVAARVRG